MDHLVFFLVRPRGSSGIGYDVVHLPINRGIPPPIAGYMDRHLTQQKKGNRKSFRPRCGRHNRTLPSRAVEMSVAFPANATVVTPPRCSASVCKQVSLKGVPSHAFHTFLVRQDGRLKERHTLRYKTVHADCAYALQLIRIALKLHSGRLQTMLLCTAAPRFNFCHHHHGSVQST